MTKEVIIKAIEALTRLLDMGNLSKDLESQVEEKLSTLIDML
ncbi:MAG TPA: hypothetical protein VMV77_22010 [Bacteroidales bacterium]|nr:hypothetical protein [Bacteroidales bacterium]